MEDDSEFEEESVILECANCFLTETVVLGPGKTQKAILHHCKYCKEHPLANLEGPEKLERILQIMHLTSAHHFPNIIRLMYKVLKS